MICESERKMIRTLRSYMKRATFGMSIVLTCKHSRDFCRAHANESSIRPYIVGEARGVFFICSANVIRRITSVSRNIKDEGLKLTG